ncbi:MAG: hypothetical protein R2750_01945 [Bacteroidales bacterium]
MNKQILNKPIRKSCSTFSPVPGNKSKLHGINHSTVIEGTKDLKQGIGHNYNNIRINSELPFSYSEIPAGIQPKLKIGKPNDKFEQEADQMAEHVMGIKDTIRESDQTPDGNSPNEIQRQCTECEEEESLQRKPLVSLNVPEIQRQTEEEEEEEVLQNETG